MNSADALEYGRIDYPNIDIIEGLKSRKLLAFKSFSMVYKCITWSRALFCLTLLSPDITQPLRFFLLSPPIATDALRIRHKAYRRCKPWWECSLLRNFEVSIRCLGPSNLMGGTGTCTGKRGWRMKDEGWRGWKGIRQEVHGCMDGMRASKRA